VGLVLSSGQRRLWFLDRLREGRSTEYNMPYGLQLRGPLDRGALKRAIDTIVERHEALRTHFEEEEGEPVQVIGAPVSVPLPIDDLSALDEDIQRQQIQHAFLREWDCAFDLSRGPLFRVRLLRLGPETHVLLHNMHHIVWDAWSHGIWHRELAALYGAFAMGLDSPLPSVPIQYADYARRQQTALAEDAVERALVYWSAQLSGIPTQHGLPVDRARQPVPTFAAGSCHTKVEAPMLASLEQFSRAHRVTPYMTLLAALAVVLARHSGDEDIIVGSPLADRSEEVADLIGFFVNFLPMRLRVSPASSLMSLLRQVQQTALAAYDHQPVPFERLVERVAPARSLNAPPIFQVLFAFQNAPWVPPQLPGLQVDRIDQPALRVSFDLEVHAAVRACALEIEWVYSRDLFDEWRVAQISSHYERALAALVRSSGLPVGAVELMDSAERHQALHRWTSDAPHTPNETVVDLFERQAATTPDRVAIVQDRSALTYAGLSARANQLARVLMDEGAGPEQLVAIGCRRSVDLAIAVLAVLKTGAAFLPLDLDDSAARLEQMIRESAPRSILTTRTAVQPWMASAPQLFLDDDRVRERCAAKNDSNVVDAERSQRLSTDAPAYIVYTSGSSGMPKGVVGLHRGLAGRLKWFDSVAALDGRPVLAKTSIAFIDGVTELLTPLAFAGVVVLAETGTAKSLVDLAALVRKHQIAQITVVPTLLRVLLDEWPASDRAVCRRWISSGELLPPSLARDFGRKCPGAALLNLYGMSEGSGDSLWTLCHDSHVAFEAAVAGNDVYVLDGRLEPVPRGVCGEVYIAGTGLARGYLHQAALTAERFVANPYGAPGSRLYRTGDTGRPLADGSLELVGRADNQVKIDGIRIELGDVEAALMRLDAIRSAAVVAKESRDRTVLVAYIVPVGPDFDPKAAHRELHELLPPAMIPSRFVTLAALPLLSNGKTDRSALPDPSEPLPDPDQAMTEEERVLCRLFSELFECDRVGRQSSFFELGGHSLQSMRLVSRIRSLLDVEMSPAAVFDTPVVADLAQHLASLRAEQRFA
jgi:nonribosomal peptide synthetase DhbF